MNFYGGMIENRYIIIYTVLIAILPSISIYASGIPGVNLGEILLILFALIGLLKKGNNNIVQSKYLLIISFYIVFITLISMLFDSSQINDVFVRTIRFLFYIFVVFFLSRKFFDFDTAIDAIRNVSIIATFFIIGQTVIYRALGFVLKGFLPFLSLYSKEYESINYELFYETVFYRPTSFFLEPAHFAQYIVFGIVICLFNKNFKLKDFYIGIFLTLGIVLSTSGQGLVIAVFVWGIFVIELLISLNKSREKKLLEVIIPFFSLISAPFIFSSEAIRNNVVRLLNSTTNSAISARSQGYLAFFDKTNLFSKILGAGYGNTPEGYWFSGFAYILYCTGLIGVILMLIFFANQYRVSSLKLGKMLIIVTILLSISAEIFNSYWLVFTFSLILYSNLKSAQNECEINGLNEGKDSI